MAPECRVNGGPELEGEDAGQGARSGQKKSAGQVARAGACKENASVPLGCNTRL